MLRHWLVGWLRSGCERVNSLSLERKIIQVNAASLVLLAALVGFGAAYLLSGNPALLRAGLIQLPAMAIAAAIPRLNRAGHHGVARWLLLLGSTATIAAAVAFSSGTELDVHFVFIVLAVSAGLLFPFRAWRSVVALVTLNTGLFLWCEFVGVASPPALERLPDVLRVAFRFGYIGTSLLAIFVVTWLAERSGERNERALEDLSGIDPLTGLANRRRVRQRLTDVLAMSKRIRQHVGVLYLDLDNFKPLNDRAGHDAGDQLLREVATRLVSCVREMDLAARVGGDEFVVVTSHLGGDRTDAATRMALVGETIRERLARPYHVSQRARHGAIARFVHECTASIGGAIALGEDMGPDALLDRADAAMFRAKSAGRDRVLIDDRQSPGPDGRPDP